jgi:hypothetical protein
MIFGTGGTGSLVLVARVVALGELERLALAGADLCFSWPAPEVDSAVPDGTALGASSNGVDGLGETGGDLRPCRCLDSSISRDADRRVTGSVDARSSLCPRCTSGP